MQKVYENTSTLAPDVSSRVLRLQLFTIMWMSVEAVVALAASWMARSPALLAFGGDSLIELLSAAVVFHGTGVATISVVFQADDGSGDVEIEVKRGTDGTRSVTSFYGCANSEEFLKSMDSGLALLDHEMFLEFVSDTPT